jgi:hypothetical protein
MYLSGEKDVLIMSRKYTYPQLEFQSKVSGCNVSAGHSKLVKSGWKRNLGNFTMGFLSLIFYVVVFYTLITENTSIVSTECGDVLWNWVLSRFIFAILETIFLAIPISLCKDFMLGPKKHILGLVFLHTINVCVGTFVVYNAMENNSCRSALSSSSFLETPILGVIGYVYIFLDSLVVIISSFAYCRIIMAQDAEI